MRIRRSWPGKKGTRVLEGIDDAGRVRAGVVPAPARTPAVERTPAVVAAAATPMDTEDLPRPRTGPVGPADAVWLEPGIDPKLPTFHVESGDEVLVHRAGRRAVVRTSAGFVKHLRAGRGIEVAEVSARMATRARAAGFAAPEVLDHTPETVTFAPLAGHSPEAFARMHGTLVPAFEEWARRWPGLVTGDVASCALRGVPVHGPEDEIRVVDTWTRHLLDFAPAAWVGEYAAEIRAARDRVIRGLGTPRGGRGQGTRSADGALVLAHRDLHDGQILVDGGTECDTEGGTGPLTVGILDFDTAALAEPELDVANLVEHLRFRVGQGLWDAAAAEGAITAVLGVIGDLHLDAARLSAYRAATRLRLACVHAFRPADTDLARRTLESLAAHR